MDVPFPRCYDITSAFLLHKRADIWLYYRTNPCRLCWAHYAGSHASEACVCTRISHMSEIDMSSTCSPDYRSAQFCNYPLASIRGSGRIHMVWPLDKQSARNAMQNVWIGFDRSGSQAWASVRAWVWVWVAWWSEKGCEGLVFFEGSSSTGGACDWSVLHSTRALFHLLCLSLAQAPRCSSSVDHMQHTSDIRTSDIVWGCVRYLSARTQQVALAHCTHRRVAWLSRAARDREYGG